VSDANLLLLCTGNAARSVMAGYMVDRRAQDLALTFGVRTAGTHVVEGQPMSMRTRAGLAAVSALGEVPAGRHRSHQVTAEDLAWADLVVVMEADHVRFIRRHHPAAARRTATLRRLCRELAPGPGALEGRVADLGLAAAELGDWEDVIDPAGGEVPDYVACAQELWSLCGELVTLVGG
jgi:protein-tyrosine-phosphatase